MLRHFLYNNQLQFISTVSFGLPKINHLISSFKLFIVLTCCVSPSLKVHFLLPLWATCRLAPTALKARLSWYSAMFVKSRPTVMTLFFKQHNSWSRWSIRVQTWVSYNTIRPAANSANCLNSIAAQDKYNKQLKICARFGHDVQGVPCCFLSKVSPDQDVPAVLCAPLQAISKSRLTVVQFSWCHRCAKVDTRANDGTYLLQLEMLTVCKTQATYVTQIHLLVMLHEI